MFTARREGSALSGALVGRELEILQLTGRLKDLTVRLLTLTGPAGVGKSRLAAEAAAEVAPEFGEVRFVEPTGGAQLADATADLHQCPGRTLLVLDGREQEARPSARELTDLLERHPGLVVLAIGREPLRVSGERLLPVTPLPVPEPGEDDPQVLREVPSVALFVRRAQDATPGFDLTLENASAVSEICRRLEGLPLALELAAGRLRMFQPQVLAARLRRRTTGLTGGPATAPERHRSLAALAAWSCRGLNPEARALLDDAAVHEGGFGMALVGRGGEGALEALIDRSLVTVAAAQQGRELDEPRLAVPEPIRSHVLDELERSGRAEAALDAHAERYRKLVAGAEPRLAGTEQAGWLRMLAADAANVRATLRRLDERGDREAVAAVVLGYRLPWLVQGGLREGLEWCDRTAAEDGPPIAGALRARLIDLSGCFATALGDAHDAVRRHRRALAVGKDLGDRRQYAVASAHLGTALLTAGDPVQAQTVLVAALSTLESLGAAGPAAETATGLARVLRGRGERRKAKELLDRAEESCRRRHDGRGLAGALREAAAYAEEEGDTDAADRALRECLRLYEAIGERTELPVVLEEFALLLLRVQPEQHPRALRLLVAAAGQRGELGVVGSGPRGARVTEALAGLKAGLDRNGFATAWAEGDRMPLPGAIAEALSTPSPTRGRVVSADPEAPSLTPRQVQVAMLVAEGMTNRQIAVRLEISEWTVVNHVRQVMRRLNCTSRVQVAWSASRWT